MIAKAPFGTTGHESTRTIFGAAALGSVTQAEADATLALLLEHGVNHIDTAASYGDSELRLAPWLAEHRDEVFLATKTGHRRYAEARDEIRRSLERLGVEHVDLIQLHNLVDPIEWETALRDGGALDAAVEAREEGLVRFIGVTGHGLTVARMHRRSLERFPFDSVLVPYSYVQLRDERYEADFEELVGVCAERGVAVQTIKAITLAPWNGREQTAATSRSSRRSSTLRSASRLARRTSRWSGYWSGGSWCRSSPRPLRSARARPNPAAPSGTCTRADTARGSPGAPARPPRSPRPARPPSRPSPASGRTRRRRRSSPRRS